MYFILLLYFLFATISLHAAEKTINWNAPYIGVVMDLKNITSFKDITLQTPLNIKHASLVMGYNKLIMPHCLIGMEAFLERNKSTLMQRHNVSSRKSALPHIPTYTTSIISENSINKGLRLTLGSNWNIMKPYIWYGIYYNPVLAKKSKHYRYSSEYGAGLDIAAFKNINLRFSYAARNINYLQPKLSYIPKPNKEFFNVNYGLTSLALGLILRF